ncbi:FAM92 protein [Phytophthora cinnamomi]|uniref:FAM92 protein n=1 Tax=Phytophthora cinnamomi TaxID=4785 RepID=UPI00355945B6|nr:FAM92 protein [Phytophthora cinnamomi]
MEPRGRSLQAQLQFMERNGRALEELVARMLKAREEQEAFLGAFAKSLEDIAAQEECAPLAQCLGSLGECGQRLASESHDVMLLRPETEILQVVTQIQDWAVVPMKRLLEDREKAIKIEAKLQKEYDELRRGSSAKEKEKKLRMLSDQKRRVENVNALLETHLENFDRYRIQKMKKIVNELARSHAFYHAKGLELFAAPCQAIAKLQPTDHLKAPTQANPADAS